MISWGYFIDHNLFEPHCNAHPNNFIVLDLESNGDPAVSTTPKLLAPLDFDMSYEFNGFVSILEDLPEKLGTNDRE